MAQNQTTVNKSFWAEIGLGRCGKFYRDGHFVLVLAAGVGVWGVAWFAAPQFFANLSFAEYALLASVILWQPTLEELLFRGVIQGQAVRQAWGKIEHWGVSGANLFTTGLFVLSHLIYHTPIWAAAVLVPSLVFGYFRDRYQSVWPGVALHIFYNAGYFLIGAMIHEG